MDIRALQRELQANKKALEPKVSGSDELIVSRSPDRVISTMIYHTLCMYRRGCCLSRKGTFKRYRVSSLLCRQSWEPSYSHNSIIMSSKRYDIITI